MTHQQETILLIGISNTGVLETFLQQQNIRVELANNRQEAQTQLGKTTPGLHAVLIDIESAPDDIIQYIEDINKQSPHLSVILTAATPTNEELARRLASQNESILFVPKPDVSGELIPLIQAIEKASVNTTFRITASLENSSSGMDGLMTYLKNGPNICKNGR